MLYTRQHHRIKLCQKVMHLPAGLNGVRQLQARITENNSTSRSTSRLHSLTTAVQSICVHLPRNIRALHFLCRRFDRNSLKPKGRRSCLGPSKSCSCWPQTRQTQFHPTVPLNGSPLPLDGNPRILIVTFYPLFHFYKHLTRG